ncbi:MAG: hypothetical protein OEZ35_05825 [Candidatus Bathyarchaeota archaeon]|nr:hypothetical protein [Candidatus Bathyarchaeota archaeon]
MPSQKMTKYADKVELEAWCQATFVVVSLAALVFVVQRLLGPIFEVALEICIFYVPAVTIALLYLYFRTKLTVKSQA